MSEPVTINAICANCALWRPVNFGGPVEIGSPKRGQCYALPPTPCAVFQGRQVVGQVNIRPVTNEPDTCGMFMPRADLVALPDDSHPMAPPELQS